MTYFFRKAQRENTPILVAFAGESGCGKTYSAQKFARGLVGPNGKIAAIDTEARRMLHYSDQFDFDHLDLAPPFTPTRYRDAIVTAEEAGYDAIIVDSASHEWAGDGGCQDMHDDILERLAGNDANKAERMNVLAWRDPKIEHKKMMSRLLQCRAHLIFCLRAEEKIKFVKVDGKTKIEAAGWVPICEKNFMFEMTVSFLMHSENPGVGIPTKLQAQHRPFFDLSQPIDEESGRKMAEWAAGAAPRDTGKAGEFITADMHIDLTDRLNEAKIDQARFLRIVSKNLGKDIGTLAAIPRDFYERALAGIAAIRERQ